MGDAGLHGSCSNLFCSESSIAVGWSLACPACRFRGGFLRSLSVIPLFLIKLMESRSGNTDEKEAARQTPFQFIQFFCNQLAHVHRPFFLRKSKNSRPYRDESQASCFHPISCTCHQDTPCKVLSNPQLCIGSSRRDLLYFQPLKLGNALQYPIRIRFHSPDSLDRHQMPTLFFIVLLTIL